MYDNARTHEGAEPKPEVVETGADTARHFLDDLLADLPDDAVVSLVTEEPLAGKPARETGWEGTVEAIVEETRAPGASMSVVARRYDINANLLFKWKRQAEAVEHGVPPPASPEFVPIGVVGRANDGGPALLARMPEAEHRNQGNDGPESELRQRSGLECRPGVIEIDLPDGARVRVDAFVDARALGRVLSALKRRP